MEVDETMWIKHTHTHVKKRVGRKRICQCTLEEGSELKAEVAVMKHS